MPKDFSMILRISRRHTDLYNASIATKYNVDFIFSIFFPNTV